MYPALSQWYQWKDKSFFFFSVIINLCGHDVLAVDKCKQLLSLTLTLLFLNIRHEGKKHLVNGKLANAVDTANMLLQRAKQTPAWRYTHNHTVHVYIHLQAKQWHHLLTKKKFTRMNFFFYLWHFLNKYTNKNKKNWLFFLSIFQQQLFWGWHKRTVTVLFLKRSHLYSVSYVVTHNRNRGLYQIVTLRHLCPQINSGKCTPTLHTNSMHIDNYIKLFTVQSYFCFVFLHTPSVSLHHLGWIGCIFMFYLSLCCVSLCLLRSTFLWNPLLQRSHPNGL